MKSLFEQLGGTYHWEGDYLIPDITLPDEDETPVGIWGQRHGRWLKQEHHALYDNARHRASLCLIVLSITDAVKNAKQFIIGEVTFQISITYNAASEV